MSTFGRQPNGKGASAPVKPETSVRVWREPTAEPTTVPSLNAQLSVKFMDAANKLGAAGANFHRVASYRRVAVGLTALTRPVETLTKDMLIQVYGASFASKILAFVKLGIWDDPS